MFTNLLKVYKISEVNRNIYFIQPVLFVQRLAPKNCGLTRQWQNKHQCDKTPTECYM